MKILVTGTAGFIGFHVVKTLQKLGVVPSFSRPSVSNDNPYSEAMFKTLKYCATYPDKPFKNIEESRSWVKKFVYWYNNIHKHSALKFVTPNERHNNMDEKILENRIKIYKNAKNKNPNRWSGNIRNWKKINEVFLNPGKNDKYTTKCS